MFLDHPTITATNSSTEPDRLERLSRVYGYVVALADRQAGGRFIEKVAQLHDHKGTLIVFWGDTPSEAEKAYFADAWASKIGDGTSNVEHEV
ncbi:hypothetical protein [Massilia psychrophila]|jgi:hypothetical protein|uniref:Uncharacterized protein n=1 Tax=Massilia psychrophila TaxID=1603353 RepID=A0A2G8T5R3_9BURK|nr:hypothetical protein [Massilia psychrophila]PIL40998.1 hypothetical protein CR103_04500 [Massilia psychrophila]GGE68521.1 hypothetical protein GCM10008020_11200 [Massilia psychrophila]